MIDKKTDMISVLCPTRERPELFTRMVDSALMTGGKNFELLAYVDDDDPKLGEYARLDLDGVKLIAGLPDGVGKAWNRLAREAKGNLLMMANDDLVFRTDGWDERLMTAIDSRGLSDGVFVAWANDGAPGCGRRCAFPIVSRRWVEIIGQFAPECFNFLYHDTWVHDVGRLVDRLIYVPDVLIEHKHFSFKKADYDATYRRHREGRENKAKRKQDEQTYKNSRRLREQWAQLLKTCMETI